MRFHIAISIYVRKSIGADELSNPDCRLLSVDVVDRTCIAGCRWTEESELGPRTQDSRKILQKLALARSFARVIDELGSKMEHELKDTSQMSARTGDVRSGSRKFGTEIRTDTKAGSYEQRTVRARS